MTLEKLLICVLRSPEVPDQRVRRNLHNTMKNFKGNPDGDFYGRMRTPTGVFIREKNSSTHRVRVGAGAEPCHHGG